MGSSYVDNLVNKVIDASEANTWDAAVLEWKIIDCFEDSSCNSCCICGKEHIKYLYTIANCRTKKRLVPIGSSCIRKFGREDMDDQTSIMEQVFRLFHAVEQNQYLTLSSELFSRKLLLWLYQHRAFDTAYNYYDGSDDYEFTLKMYNKRDKESITPAQDRKIKAILLHSIKPYLQKILRNKIR